MKRILFFLLLVINLSAFGQVPSGYTQAGWRYKVKAFIFDSTLHIPSYNGTPSGIRTGGWVGDGAIGMDTTNHRMYIYSGGAWLRLASYAEAMNSWSLTGNSINAGTDFIGTTNNTSMRFRTNNTVRMVLDSNGNVGIGTTSPTALLHVVDNSVTDGIGFKISSSSLSSGSLVNISATSTAADLSSQRGLNVTLSGANATGGQNTYSGYFSNLHTGAGSNFGIYSEANGGNNNKAIIGTSTSTGGIGINGFVTGASAYAGYFENSGGSGTGYGMYVTKTGSATNNIAGYFTASGGTNNYAILVPTSGGSVGIGTSSPDSLLTVELGIRGKRGARFDGLPTFADTTNYKPVVINSSGTLYKATYWPGGGGGSGWSLTGNAGTTSSNFIGTTDAQPLMFRYNNLNAGSIGKSSGGTYLGIGAGENDNVEDEPNVGVGYYALYYNTTGSANSAVGAYALYSNTTGYNNSAVGSSALSSNTTGAYNSAVGASALYNNTTGAYNSVVGIAALASNTTGYNNSAVGASAGNNAKQKPDAKYQTLLGSSTYGTRDSITVLGADFIKETIVRGKLIDSTLSAGAGTKAVRWDSSTGEFTYADTTAGGANQGSDVASANNLAVVANTTEITGTTQVNLIANTGWVNGAEINLLLANGITIKNGQTTSGSNITILLDGAADFVTASASMLTLVLSEVGGTQAWREKSRRSY